MIRRNLFVDWTLDKKLFLSFFGVFLVFFLVVFLFQYQREKNIKEEQLDFVLITYNNLINRHIEEYDRYLNKNIETIDSAEYKHIQEVSYNDLRNFIEVFPFPDMELRVTIASIDGKILFDSRVVDYKRIGNILERSEIQEADVEDYGKIIRKSVISGLDNYFVAKKYKNRYVRSALVFDINLKKALKGSTTFIYYGIFLIFLSFIVISFISSKFKQLIDQLKLFTQHAERGELNSAVVNNIDFPEDEFGEIGKNIVQLYTQLLTAKEQITLEKERLINHLKFLAEGFGVFRKDKSEIYVNSHFDQYANFISDQICNNADLFFSDPEFISISHFIDENIHNQEIKQKDFLIEKNDQYFKLKCIIFLDNTFEISINDITVEYQENEMKKQLTQNISHELKTPVSSILGYLESIIANKEMDEKYKEIFIERSYKQTLRLNSLIQDLSILNKLEDAKYLLEKKKHNIVEIIQNAISDIEYQLKVKRCGLHLKLKSEIVANVNSSLIYSIFKNLIENSLMHGGEDLTKIEIESYKEDDDFFYFSFRDDGVGVPKNNLPLLFERFYRVDQGRRRKDGGSGLGLAIVKHAVIFHNGSISVKNASKGGLVFFFTLKKE